MTFNLGHSGYDATAVAAMLARQQKNGLEEKPVWPGAAAWSHMCHVRNLQCVKLLRIAADRRCCFYTLLAYGVADRL